MAASENSWQNLFATDSGDSGKQIQLRVVSRGGQPFLILPSAPGLAAQALQLYSAQTFRARVMRAMLKRSLRLNLPLMAARVSLRVRMDDPFVHFLQNLAHDTRGEFPKFGMLAGNPGAAGRRFILMVFNSAQTPAAIVKVGLDDEAKKLIGREAAFLESIPRGTGNVVAGRGQFEQPRLRALAMDFTAGESPRAADESAIPDLLTSWIHPHKTVAIGLTRTWWELEQSCAADPSFELLSAHLSNRIVHPVIFHGDFAPWNIKVRDGAWKVFDWERGELNGLPGYDWFHFIIQTRILVAKKSAAGIVNELTALIASPPFQQYARHAGIVGVERELVLAYLLHHNEVIHPVQGRTQGRELFNTLATLWLKNP